MKKMSVILPLLILTACRPTSRQVIYSFGHDNGLGTLVNHIKSENKFDVVLRKKQTYFIFFEFMIGEKSIRPPELNTMFTFTDTGGETITLDDEGCYLFEKILDERTISICYGESIRGEIIGSELPVWLEVNGYTFTNCFTAE